jgi:hypothetical protein
MGSLFGGGETKQTTKSSVLQEEQVKSMLAGAVDDYNNKQTQDLPLQQYAGLNSDQLAAINYIQQFAANNGSVAQTGDAASTGLGAMNPFVQNANNFAAGNFGNAGGANAGQVNAFNDTSLAALMQAGTYGNNAQTLFNTATSDPTQQNVAAASAYMNNPLVQGQIDAVNRDVARNLNENTLPTLNMQASAGGNLNSSRAGAAEAVATRAASDQMADNASNIRSAAYNNGLQLAEQARSTNLNAANAANGQVGNYANMGFSNTLNGMNFGEGQRQFNVGTQQQANAQLGQAASMGTENATAQTELASSLYQLLAGAGATKQTDQQNQNNTDYLNQMGLYNKNSADLATFKSLLDGNYGGTDVTSSKKSSNVGGQVLGAIATVAAAYFTGGASLAVQAGATAAAGAAASAASNSGSK